MIIETIIGSITAITCSALWLTNAIHKREHDDDERTELDKELQEDLPPAEILPNMGQVTQTTRCPFCGDRGQEHYHSNDFGPNLPKACTGKECRARRQAHLHVSCKSCNTHWFMAPMNVSKKPTSTQW